VKAGWKHEWIKATKDITQREWQLYKPAGVVAHAVPLALSSVSFFLSLYLVCILMYVLITQASTSLSEKYFAALKDRSAPVDALEEWLSSALVVKSLDGITVITSGYPSTSMIPYIQYLMLHPLSFIYYLPLFLFLCNIHSHTLTPQCCFHH
jgi:hypothetical protein